MSTIIRSDLITMKNAALQLAIMPVIVSIVITLMTGSLIVGTSAVAIMVPFMYLFSISSYDELNGWERFRLTLPITRRSVAYGRYASTLIVIALCFAGALVLAALMMGIGSLIPSNALLPDISAEENPPEMIFLAVCLVSTLMLVVAAITYPFIMRFGLTKSTRLAPVMLILLLAIVIWLISDSGLLAGLLAEGSFADLANLSSVLPWLIGLGGLCIALVLFALSALLSARLYEKRQF